MIRFLLRAAGFVLFAVAFASLVVDGTRSIAAQHLLQFSFGESAAWLAGGAYRAILARVALWPDPLPQGFTTLLAAPTWIVMAALGLALSFAGRQPRPRPGLLLR